MARRKGLPRGFSFPAHPALVRRFDQLHFQLSALGQHLPRQDFFQLVVARGLDHAELVLESGALDPPSSRSSSELTPPPSSPELDPAPTESLDESQMSSSNSVAGLECALEVLEVNDQADLEPEEPGPVVDLDLADDDLRIALLAEPPARVIDPADPLARFRMLSDGKTREGEAIRRDLASLFTRTE